MSDDIVKYLRLSQTRFNRHAEAADEIERLRALINHGLTDAYQCAGCDLCKQLKAMHLQAIKP